MGWKGQVLQKLLLMTLWPEITFDKKVTHFKAVFARFLFLKLVLIKGFLYQLFPLLSNTPRRVIQRDWTASAETMIGRKILITGQLSINESHF